MAKGFAQYKCGRKLLRQNREDSFAFAMRLFPEQHVYAPRFAVNGRRHPQAGPNLWRTDALEARLHTGMGCAHFSCVELTVDTDLNCDWGLCQPAWVRSMTYRMTRVTRGHWKCLWVGGWYSSLRAVARGALPYPWQATVVACATSASIDPPITFAPAILLTTPWQYFVKGRP